MKKLARTVTTALFAAALLGAAPFAVAHATTMEKIDAEVSEALNPGCRHVQGDMGEVRLGERFDAVFVHDAVAYLTTEAELEALAATAYEHCEPGGVVLLSPDGTRESFASSTSHGGHDGPDGRGIRYLEWTWDPDPDDHEVMSEYVLVVRDVDGAVRSSKRYI